MLFFGRFLRFIGSVSVIVFDVGVKRIELITQFLGSDSLARKKKQIATV